MSRFFVGRPIVAMVIAILTVIVGAVAMLGLPVAQYPNIVPPQIQVRTLYTGADAVTVEQSVATPIEQQMSGVEKMLYVQSTNANDGSLLLQVTFDIDSNIDIDQVNTQNKVAQAQPSLRSHRVGELLTVRSWLRAEASGRIDVVLHRDRIRQVGDGEPELRQLVRLDPDAHRVIGGAK